jgi:hypothetical protein
MLLGFRTTTPVVEDQLQMLPAAWKGVDKLASQPQLLCAAGAGGLAQVEQLAARAKERYRNRKADYRLFTEVEWPCMAASVDFIRHFDVTDSMAWSV